MSAQLLTTWTQCRRNVEFAKTVCRHTTSTSFPQRWHLLHKEGIFFTKIASFAQRWHLFHKEGIFCTKLASVHKDVFFTKRDLLHKFGIFCTNMAAFARRWHLLHKDGIFWGVHQEPRLWEEFYRWKICQYCARVIGATFQILSDIAPHSANNIGGGGG